MFFSEHPLLDLLARSLLLGPMTMLWVVGIVRVNGLRSFSKMTAFDFIATIATGSLLAGAARAENWSAFAQPTLAIGSMIGFQFLLASARRRSGTVKDAILNQPVLLFKDGAFLRDALKRTRVTEEDLWAKLRGANVTRFSEIEVMVLETTGDVSILRGNGLEPAILTGVAQ